MGNEIFAVIKKACVFLIGAQLILHLKPNGMYEKYLKFIVHLMTLTLFMMPLFQIFGQTEETAFSESLAKYEEMMRESMTEINYICDLSEEKRQQIYKEEIKSRLNIAAREEAGEETKENGRFAGQSESREETQGEENIEPVEIEVKVHEDNSR